MHPILFYIGSFPIATYGVMIVTGLLFGLWLAGLIGGKSGIPREFFYDLAFVVLISGFVGARAVFIMTEWHEFVRDPLPMIFSRGGFVFLGGFLAAAATAVWHIRRRGLPLLTVADVMAAPIALAHAFGRIGCFFAGCCYGEFCLPGEAAHGLKHLAVQYPLVYDKQGQISDAFNYAYFAQQQAGLIPPLAVKPLPLIPVQLMESAGNFIICAILLILWRRRKFSGAVFGAYLALYSVLRFTLEFWRGDVERGVYFNGAVSVSQIICIFTFALGAWLLWSRRGKGMEAIPDFSAASDEETQPEIKPAAGGRKTPRSAKKRS